MDAGLSVLGGGAPLRLPLCFSEGETDDVGQAHSAILMRGSGLQLCLTVQPYVNER